MNFKPSTEYQAYIDRCERKGVLWAIITLIAVVSSIYPLVMDMPFPRLASYVGGFGVALCFVKLVDCARNSINAKQFP